MEVARGALLVLAAFSLGLVVGWWAHEPEVVVRGGGEVVVDCGAAGICASVDCLDFSDLGSGCSVLVRNIDCRYDRISDE